MANNAVQAAVYNYCCFGAAAVRECAQTKDRTRLVYVQIRCECDNIHLKITELV